MSIRQIQIMAPLERADEIRKLLEEEPTNTFSLIHGAGEEEKCLFMVITRTGNVQNLLDRLQDLILVDGKETALVTILNAEGSIPYPETEEEISARASREELYTSVSARAELTNNYYLLVILSTIVAFIGFRQNSPAMVIAAMVLAPLLGPNIAGAFASLIGNKRLWKRAMKAATAGIVTAFLVSGLLGVILPVDVAIPQVASRTVFSWAILILALVSGIAGALTFTTALSEALVGVMVGIALLPPIVALGTTIGGGHFEEASGAFTILVSNIAGLNLAAIATFRLQGIKPRFWYQQKSARRVTWLSLIFWALILGMVIISQWF